MDANDGEFPGPSRKSTTSVESIVNLREVVNILTENLQFVRTWKEFYYALQTPSPDFDQWDRSYNNNTMTIKEILIKILGDWVMVHGKEATIGKLRAALISEKFISVAEALNGQYPDLSCTVVQMTPMTGRNQSRMTNSEVDRQISFELCNPSENFVGRSNEIQILNTFYKQKKNLVVVSGLGGVGKSELVRTFGINFLKIAHGSCIWIHGDSEESFKTSIKRLADSVLNPSKLESDKNIVEIFLEVYDRKLKKWPILLIIDNVDKSNSLVEKLIQGCKSLLDNIPLIVVTTRNKLALNNAGVNIELEMLNPNESVKMVRDGLGSWVLLSEAKKLCETMGHFPLVLQQAMSLIKHKRRHSVRKNFGVSEYLELFHKDQTKIMDYPLNVDYNYNSTTFRVWGLTLDDIKQINGSIALMAVDILLLLAYFNADGVRLADLIEFYQDVNRSHKSKIDTEDGKPGSEEIEAAVELIQTYSMCRVEYESSTRKGDLSDCNISSHRLIRDFMRSISDNEMNTKVLRRLMFINEFIDITLDEQNIVKLGQQYRTSVPEIFMEFWKLDVDEGQIYFSEIDKTNLNQTLETDGLEIHLELRRNAWEETSILSQSKLQNCHKIYQFVRHRHGLDHKLTKAIMELAGKRILQEAGLPVDTLTWFLIDMVKGRCVPRDELMISFVEFIVAFHNGNVSKETTELLMLIHESALNNFYLNDKLFSLIALATISNLFKRNGETDLCNQIQCEMFCLMEHPNELTDAWHFMTTLFYCLSFPARAFFYQNSNEIVDFGVFNGFEVQQFFIAEQVVKLLDLLIESKKICHLDVFAYVTLYWSEEKGHCDQSFNFSCRWVSNVFNKEFLIRVIKTIKAYNLKRLNKDELLSLSTEIMDSVKNGLVDGCEGIWSFGEIIKCLSEYGGVSEEKLVELIDIMERLVNTDNQKALVKRKMYSVIYDGNIVCNEYSILLFLRLQKYGFHLRMLERLLEMASVDQVVDIGNNIIENNKDGFIDNGEKFLAIKYVIKSLIIRHGEKDKATEILFKTLDIEQCPSSNGNPKNILFEKVQLTVVDVDDINIAIATFVYLVKFLDVDDPRGFLYPTIILRQILEILTQKQSNTKLLALCYEIYNFRFGWNKLHLCWTFIQILNCLVEMNKNEIAKQFIRSIIKETETDDQTETDDEDLWYHKACWFIVFGTYYEAQLDIDADLGMQKVTDFVKQLKVFETSMKNNTN